MLPKHPVPTNTQRVCRRDPRFRQELEACFIRHHLRWPGSLETRLATPALKSVPIPGLVGAAGAAAALEGTSRLEHTVSHGPGLCLLGRLQRWWPGCATHGAQRAPGSARQHLLRILERAGDGTGAVPDTPKHWDKAHRPCFHCIWSQVGCCPPRLIFRSIN